MKRFYVEQLGNVQVEATRSFVVEVPDHFTEDMTEDMLHDVYDELPDTEGLEWTDHDDRGWVGFDVDVVETDIYEADSRDTEGVEVITFADLMDDSARDQMP